MEKELVKYMIPDLANIVCEYANPWLDKYDHCVREFNIRFWHLHNSYRSWTHRQISRYFQHKFYYRSEDVDILYWSCDKYGSMLLDIRGKTLIDLIREKRKQKASAEVTSNCIIL